MAQYRWNGDNTLNHLTQVTNGTAAQQENDSYDPWNNRTLKSIGNPVTSTLAYKYDNANQLTEIHNGTLTGTLQATLGYDNNGNLQSDGTRSYTWDALNQLAQVTKGATTVAYGYDADGKRIRKATGGVTTQWLYDGQDIYAEYGATWTNPNAVYTSGGSVDDPVIKAAVTGTATYGQAQYYHADGLGSVVGLSNSTDMTTQTERFDAWGNKIAGTIPQSAQYGYTGREPDETGLTYYRARFYDPSIARFVSRDPIGLQGGINQYAYVNGNPVNFTDQTGLLAGAPNGASSGFTGRPVDDPYWNIVAAGGGRPPVQLWLPLGNLEAEPTVQNLGSMAQVRQVDERIQRYNPNYWGTTGVGGSGPTGADVQSAQNVLAAEQQVFQGRVNEFRQAQGRSIQYETIAVTRAMNPQSGTIVDIVSSSNGRLPSAIRQMLGPNEVEARGFSGHAEQNGVAWAQSRGLQPLVTGATNRICNMCQGTLIDSNVLPGSALKPGGPLF